MLDRLQAAKRSGRGTPDEGAQRRQAHQERHRELGERQVLDHSRTPGYRVRGLAFSRATRSGRAGSRASRGGSAPTSDELSAARAAAGRFRSSPVSGSFQAESDSTEYEM